MTNFGYVRVAACVPRVHVGDPMRNIEEMQLFRSGLDFDAVQVAVFPELGITGYTCGDLFHQESLLACARAALKKFCAGMATGVICIVGMPMVSGGRLFNVAVVCANGAPIAAIPKTYIPGYSEFYEQRWFASAHQLPPRAEIELCGHTIPFGTDVLIEGVPLKGSPSFRLGVELCEDLWMPIPPSSHHALAGATIIANLSASNELVGKHRYRRELVVNQSARCIAGYVYVSAGVRESTNDVVYAGDAFIAENGTLLSTAERFEDDPQRLIADVDVSMLTSERLRTGSFGQAVGNNQQATHRIVRVGVTGIRIENGFERSVHALPFVPADEARRREHCAEVFAIQCTGLHRRLQHLSEIRGGAPRDVYIGVSGGPDSTLALLDAARTYEMLGWSREHIHALTMPGYGTTEQTRGFAHRLCEALDIELKECTIVDATDAVLRASGHEPCRTCTMCENAQARVRQSILMNCGFVIGTGDLSEKALGWSTYGGDQLAMYDVNAGVPKTLVRHVIASIGESMLLGPTVSDVLAAILATPSSPELVQVDANGATPQITENIIGPYELHDFFLYHMLRYGRTPEHIAFLACEAEGFAQEYDRGTILKWLRVFYERFFANQFKREATADGPKVGSVALSPRGDWRMPADATGRLWLDEVDRLITQIDQPKR
ncbi:MAG: NAD(+) synthase [Candidatus Uhrbacteria bacterium]